MISVAITEDGIDWNKVPDSKAQSVEAQVIAREALKELQARMTARQWQVFRLCYSGMTQQEVGRLLGVGQRAVSHHFKAAMQKVRRVVAEYV